MPIYEYDCRECEGTTEALRRMAEADAPLRCEHCGGSALSRKHSVFSAGGERRGEASGTPLPQGGCGCGNPYGPCSM